MATNQSNKHFEDTYECLHCGDTRTIREDRDEGLVLASECPNCETENAALKRVDREQIEAVDMDTVTEERREECLEYVGERLVWDDRGEFTLAKAQKATDSVEGTEMVFTRLFLDWESGSRGTVSLDDFSTHLKVGNIQEAN